MRANRPLFPSPSSADAGYTLTEMLVVIGIIALIAAFLTPLVLGQMNRARIKTAELEVQTVATAVESFRSDVGRYPSAAEGLGALRQEPADVAGWAGPYISQKSLQDPWGRPLVYVAPTDASPQFYVKSLGADGKGAANVDRELQAPSQ